ncbi:MAG: alpha-amylase/4-alpha-glucanotransferase domain-containing protein, partial [Caldisericia bacterium]
VEFYLDKIKVSYEIDDKLIYELETPKIKDYLIIEMNLYITEDKINIEKDLVIFYIEDKKMYLKTENSYNIRCEKIFTVSSSESGIEKIYQGETLFFIFRLKNDINRINIKLGDFNGQ